jgi:Uma2 family endonuclease
MVPARLQSPKNGGRKVASQPIQTRRWTRQEYDRMAATGIFHPEERLQLIDGEIITMTPQGSGHATAVRLTEEALRNVFGIGFDVRTQLPLALNLDSEPEPDVAVVHGSPRDYKNEHPQSAVLVVEVADATIALDRQQKASLYARAGIPEYWILNLIDRCLEIYRDPSSRGYLSVNRTEASGTVFVLSKPETAISIADLLP